MEDAHALLHHAHDGGAHLSLEMYPYGASMTAVSAPLLSPARLELAGLGPTAVMIAATGEDVPDADRLRDLRANTPRTLVIVRYLDDDGASDAALIARAISSHDVAVASDAIAFTDRDGSLVQRGVTIPDGARTHPRSVGTFA
ncbi:hypothetical protein, partial [Microbacterium sp.]|uniref:hypothetical protein n=1 Tax=Microbacterium sp. TaxID=51671 RepID=UPI003A890969